MQIHHILLSLPLSIELALAQLIGQHWQGVMMDIKQSECDGIFFPKTETNSPFMSQEWGSNSTSSSILVGNVRRQTGIRSSQYGENEMRTDSLFEIGKFQIFSTTSSGSLKRCVTRSTSQRRESSSAKKNYRQKKNYDMRKVEEYKSTGVEAQQTQGHKRISIQTE